eukprot:GHVL01001318.1.p1 GENE.GHVL01001318.1~~GHVL01001318.1.p1  ORF type:complete len:231 (+),score=26.33 GHVL01001318.1:26-718(+)
MITQFRYIILLLICYASIPISGLAGIGGIITDAFVKAVFNQCSTQITQNICSITEMMNAIRVTAQEIRDRNPNGIVTPAAVLAALDAKNWICTVCNPCEPNATCESMGCATSCICDVGNGWHGEGLVTSPCATRCNDGIIAGTENCDDRNNWPRDGCSPFCMFEQDPINGRFTYDCTNVSEKGPTLCSKIRAETDGGIGSGGGIIGGIGGGIGGGGGIIGGIIGGIGGNN